MRYANRRQARSVERLESRELLAAVDSLRIAEIMYQPAEPNGGAFIKDDFEFVELVNTAATPINLAGVSLSNGIAFDFAASDTQTLAGGARLLIVKNAQAFESRYGAGLPVAGEFAGQLANGGETLVLTDGAAAVQSVTYDDAWRPVTDGPGFSLTVLDPAAPSNLWNNASNYRGSLRGGGSPGTLEAPLDSGDIVINEILAHTDLDPGDWIELYNATEQDLNVSDWFLSDKATELNRYRIGNAKFISANGYLTFTQQDDFDNDNDAGALVPFGLSELGENVLLSSWDSNGVTAAYVESQGFRAGDREVSFGRHRISTGETMFVEQAVSTFGAANGVPLVGPVVISEIMYNQDGAGSEHEFIELHNRTGLPVTLFDPVRPENTWKFTNGIDFVIPAGVTIPANGYVVIAGIEPNAFRVANDVPTDVAVLGPWLGGLDKNGEAVTLSRPGDPELDGFVPYYRVDHVNYDDNIPWPTAADGNGPSLVLTAMDLFGNDPASWLASQRFGGTPGRPNGSSRLPGDTNNDGVVDLTDLNNVRNNFGAVGPDINGDADQNGVVDLGDLNAVRNNFGASLNAPVPIARSAARTRSTDVRTAITLRTHVLATDVALGRLMAEWNSERIPRSKRLR